LTVVAYGRLKDVIMEPPPQVVQIVSALNAGCRDKLTGTCLPLDLGPDPPKKDPVSRRHHLR
jgi:hypothetical protein